ncbi:MAG: hypothetical protein QXJ44_06055 [Candidatus Nitrosocaldus sp.]
MQSTTTNNDNITTKVKGKYTETERSFLLFFVEQRKVEMSYNEVRQYWFNKGMNIMDLHLILYNLMKKGLITEIDYCSDNNNEIYIRIANKPLLVKVLLNLRYTYSATILTALTMFYFVSIVKGYKVKFNLTHFVYGENRYNIKFAYIHDNKTFKNSLNELINKQYLTRLSRNNYLFNYTRLPEYVLNFLLANK